jgi:hypothetical protein
MPDTIPTNVTAEQTWEIRDLDGSNRRRVTLAQFLAENRKRADEAKAIFAASVRSLRTKE